MDAYWLTFNGKALACNGKVLVNDSGPALPPYTIRLKFTNGVTPTFSYGTAVQVSTSPNIWDLTYARAQWTSLLSLQSDLLEVIEANTSGVTNMHNMFGGCSSLTSVPLFDTSSVTDMDDMFGSCSSLTSVPLFDTSNVTNMTYMFTDCSALTSVPLFNTQNVIALNYTFALCTSLTSIPLFDTSSVISMDHAFHECYNVQSGALALYQQASTQATPPTGHYLTFTNCGRDTTTGAAELAQIPTSWGGTGT